MGKYLLRRILQMIPVVLGTTLLVYALVFALPGDPVKAMFGDKPVNEAVAAQIRSEYNLDKPFIVQYLLFLKNALSLNFGNTFAGQPVIDEISRAFPVTLKLALMAFCFEAIFGCVFGAISGLKKGKWYDSVILIVSLLSKEPSEAIQYEFDHYMDEELVDRHLDAVLEGGIPLKGVNMPVDTPIHPNEAEAVDEKEPVTFKESVVADAHGETLTRSAEAEGKKVEETITIEEKPE